MSIIAGYCEDTVAGKYLDHFNDMVPVDHDCTGSDIRRRAPMCPIACEVERGAGIVSDQVTHEPAAPCGGAALWGGLRMAVVLVMVDEDGEAWSSRVAMVGIGRGSRGEQEEGEREKIFQFISPFPCLSSVNSFCVASWRSSSLAKSCRMSFIFSISRCIASMILPCDSLLASMRIRRPFNA